jgi:hypothetical protein
MVIRFFQGTLRGIFASSLSFMPQFALFRDRDEDWVLKMNVRGAKENKIWGRQENAAAR